MIKFSTCNLCWFIAVYFILSRQLKRRSLCSFRESKMWRQSNYIKLKVVQIRWRCRFGCLGKGCNPRNLWIRITSLIQNEGRYTAGYTAYMLLYIKESMLSWLFSNRQPWLQILRRRHSRLHKKLLFLRKVSIRLKAKTAAIILW